MVKREIFQIFWSFPPVLSGGWWYYLNNSVTLILSEIYDENKGRKIGV